MKHLLADKIQATFLTPHNNEGKNGDHAAWLTDIHPALRLRVSTRARRIALRLDHNGRVMHLVVPARFSLRKARQFAQDHKDWITAKLSESPAPVRFIHGAQIPVLGRTRTLNIDHDSTRKVTDIQLRHNEILIITNRQDPAARLMRFLKEEARDTLAGLAAEKAASIGKTVREIKIRDTKSRWGSCTPDGRICFSWRLVFAPWESLDYVVAHEVAHLIHMNHSKAFWDQCATLSENYETGKRWIRNNGPELMRYG